MQRSAGKVHTALYVSNPAQHTRKEKFCCELSQSGSRSWLQITQSRLHSFCRQHHTVDVRPGEVASVAVDRAGERPRGPLAHAVTCGTRLVARLNAHRRSGACHARPMDTWTMCLRTSVLPLAPCRTVNSHLEHTRLFLCCGSFVCCREHAR